MKKNNTFGVHFVLRTSRPSDDDKFPVYARIVVNATRCEFSMKQSLSKADWNFGKGAAKPKNSELRALNSHLQEMHGKLHRHYRDLLLEDEPLTATVVKAAFLGIGKEPTISYSLLWLVNQHQILMQKVLKPGTMKNYHATESYLKRFLVARYKKEDMPLKDLNYEFISGFEFFVRNSSLKENDPCTTNGTMKHLERLKKMVTWAVKNEWIGKDPFSNFRLKFKHTEREFLSEAELAVLESPDLEISCWIESKTFSCSVVILACLTSISWNYDLSRFWPGLIRSNG